MRTPESKDRDVRLHNVAMAAGSAARLEPDRVIWPASLKALVNIGGCGKHATSNRNSYEPFRPQKNGRLGAEPDTAICLEPLGNVPGGSFLWGEACGFPGFAQRIPGSAG